MKGPYMVVHYLRTLMISMHPQFRGAVWSSAEVRVQSLSELTWPG